VLVGRQKTTLPLNFEKHNVAQPCHHILIDQQEIVSATTGNFTTHSSETGWNIVRRSGVRFIEMRAIKKTELMENSPGCSATSSVLKNSRMTKG